MPILAQIHDFLQIFSQTNYYLIYDRLLLFHFRSNLNHRKTLRRCLTSLKAIQNNTTTFIWQNKKQVILLQKFAFRNLTAHNKN